MIDDKKRSEILAIVHASPQFKVLKQENIESWIDAVSKLDDHDPAWHAKRLRGIGSSEIGSCLESARGEYTPFGGAREMVMSKLMMLAPDAGTGHTKRGNEMEDFIRNKFHRQFNTKSEDQMMKHMMSSVVPGAPWMVGNPDDLCFIDGNLYLIDYKAPTTETLRDVQNAGGVKFEYACQLHHLYEIGRHAGLPIKGKLLCSIDWERWELDVRDVAHNSALIDEIYQVGNELWYEFVCKGDLPAMDLPQYVDDVSEVDRTRLSALAEHMAIVDGIAKVATEAANATKKEILEITRAYNIGEKRIDLPGGYVKSKPEMDIESLTAFAGMFGVDFDTENPESIQAAITELEKQGYPKEKFETEAHRFVSSRSKKGLDFDLIQACKEIGANAVEEKLKEYKGSFLQAYGVAGKENEAGLGKSKRQQTKVTV